jgi:hypothetical protein
MMQPPPYPPAPGYDYEFDDAQNATIASAALWARVLGIVMLVVGVASLLNCNVITLIIDLVVGINLLGGASSLSMVVNTQGNDVAHMMQAIGKLGTAFKVRVIATLVGLVLIFVLVAVVFVLAFASAASSR